MNSSVPLHFEHKCNVTIITKALQSYSTMSHSFIQKLDNYYDVMERNQVGQLYGTS